MTNARRTLRSRRRRRTIAWAVTTLLVAGAVFATVGIVRSTAPGAASAAPPPESAKVTPSGGPKAQRETGSAKAASYSLVVNKRRPLTPIHYVPTDLVQVHVPYIGVKPLLRPAVAEEVEAMFADFTKQTGLEMQSNSAYRSYSDQETEYRTFSTTLGSDAAAETTARPGYSEHQTGLAIDIGAKGSNCSARDCFAATAQSRWLATNAWRFGFIIRYPNGQQAVTGYTYEPWHIRYVGPALAKKIHGHYSSLEAYFHLPAAPTY